MFKELDFAAAFLLLAPDEIQGQGRPTSNWGSQKPKTSEIGFNFTDDSRRKS